MTEYEEELKFFIRESEQRFIWYKKELELVFKDKEHFPHSEQTEWYKNTLRELKNIEEQWLRLNQEEIVYFRNDLNPPYLYKK